MGHPAFCIFVQYKKLTFPRMYRKIGRAFKHPGYLIAVQAGCIDYPSCLYPALACAYVPDFAILHFCSRHFTVKDELHAIGSTVFSLGIYQIKRLHHRLPWAIDCPQHSFCQFRLHCFSFIPAHELHIIVTVGSCMLQPLFQYLQLKTVVGRHDTSAGIITYLQIPKNPVKHHPRCVGELIHQASRGISIPRTYN